MNIRFSRGQIRFRLSESEHQELLQEGKVSAQTSIPEGSFTYQVSLGASPKLSQVAGGGVSLSIDREGAEALLLQRGKGRASHFGFDLADGEHVVAVLEIDALSGRENRRP